MLEGAPAIPEDILARLDELEAESSARRAELRAIASELPAAMSRRAILRSLASDLRHAPGKRVVAERAARKLARAPRSAARRIGERTRA
jgi:hypothetical protein